MNKLFHHFKWWIICCFINNIIIFSITFNDYIKNFNDIFIILTSMPNGNPADSWPFSQSQSVQAWTPENFYGDFLRIHCTLITFKQWRRMIKDFLLQSICSIMLNIWHWFAWFVSMQSNLNMESINTFRTCIQMWAWKCDRD